MTRKSWALITLIGATTFYAFYWFIWGEEGHYLTRMTVYWVVISFAALAGLLGVLKPTD